MSGGRWDPQTRIAVVVVGLLVVTVGVLTTMRWQSDLGAAALVLGGLLVGLSGVAGGTILGPREVPDRDPARSDPAQLNPRAAAEALTQRADGDPAQPVLALAAGQPITADDPQNPARLEAARLEAARLEAARLEAARLEAAPIAGDTETAAEQLIQRLRASAPEAVGYYEAVRAIVETGLAGQALLPASTHPLGPLTAPDLAIAVDIRAGTGFALDRMERTFRSLCSGAAPVKVILVALNTTDQRVAQMVSDLRGPLRRPVLVGCWRLGDPAEALLGPLRAALAQAQPDGPAPQPDGPAPQPDGPAPQGSRVAVPEQASRLASQGPGQRGKPTPTEPDDSESWQAASDLHWRGQLQQAERAYRRIVEHRTRRSGWDHPDTLTARDQHAAVLRDLDRLAEALVECDEVLATRIELFGEAHPDVLTSRSHLASIYHQLGDLTRAELEHGTVLRARTRLLGATHQETLITRSNLAKVFQDLGELDRAINEHRIVLAERERSLGAEHRDTLMSRSLLASALHAAGRLADAEEQHRAVLQGRIDSLGESHLDTAVSRHRLASVLHDLGRLAEAVAEYHAAREVYAGLLGASNPFTRAATSDLALAERALRAQL